jgi:hydroxymethylbilane synthase
MRKNRKVVIATRGSKLALWQANCIKTELWKKHSGIEIELKIIKTTGDKILDVPLAKIGGKGLFVKEIEETLLKKSADLAVHSMKDVPTYLPEGLHIAAMCKRDDPRDALISRKTENRNQKSEGVAAGFSLRFKELPKKARIGTSSLRRTCQLLNIRPDLNITQLRGNLDTRIRKLNEGQFDAVIVAAAGVKRLGMPERITEILETDISLPAIGQGAIGIECRIDDKYINNLLEPLNHSGTSICVQAERAFLKQLEGGCQVPIAAYARLENTTQNTVTPTHPSPSRGEGKGGGENLDSPDFPSGTSGLCVLVIDGLVGSVSGDKVIRGSIEGIPDDAEQLGRKLAEDLVSRGAGKILADIYKK